MADQPTNRERVKEIVLGIEQNIQELFQSERFFDYLRTMSRFHSYSVNNTILIHMQRPHAAKPVAGFHKWKQAGRHVKKGEKGLTIIAPTPMKRKVEEMRLDPDTMAPVLGPDGNIIIDEKTVEIPLFKPVKVFSADQTEGKPLPSLAAGLTGDVQQYEAFMEALHRTSPMPISFGALDQNTDGLCNHAKQTITIREGMSQVQTVCAAVHEIGHAVLHDREKNRLSAAAGNTDKEPPKAKDENTMEVEAESVSYAVCQYYGIDTSANSIGYIAGWSKDKSLPELKASLDTITKTVNGLITTIDKHFAEICKERGIDLTTPELPVPEEPDTPENYVADFFAHLDGLYAAGLIPAPHPPDKRDAFEQIFLKYIREGNFNSFRYVLEDAEKRANMPATAALRDRLEKLSDQWDAAMILKIEPVYGPETAESHSMIRVYAQRDGQPIPGEAVFTGSLDECQRTMAGLEAGTITLRDVRAPEFEAPSAPEPGYVYKMDANPQMEGAEDRHYIEAYERTSQGELALDRMLFAGTAEVCANLLEQLQNGSLQYDDFFIVRAARISSYTTQDGAELDALVGADDKVYLGRRDHYDSRGHYLNNDHSLIHVSDNKSVFDVISSRNIPYTHDELRETGYFTQEELARFTALPLRGREEPAQTEPSTPEPVQVIPLETGDTTLDEYPPPDSAMTLDSLAALGYAGTDLLPLSRDRGAELVDRDMTVYMVRSGESPEMVFDREDLMEQPEGVLFAIPREEWEASPDFKRAVADRMDRQADRERAFLEHRGDCFAIYQIKDSAEQLGLRFMNMDWLRSKGLTPDRKNYDLVYTGEMAAGQGSSAMERLWQKFNNKHPPDFQHPSMSVSDIIAVKQDGVVSFHYCDSFGFARVPNFIQPENALKNTEMQIEDDDNMLDGIINNGPKATVAELEQQARSGQPISLTDWAEAVHREKKKSVVARLKGQPPQERQKTSSKKDAEAGR